MKKAELQALVDSLQSTVDDQTDALRRIRRSLKLRELDVEQIREKLLPERKSADMLPGAEEALRRSEAEFELNVTEPELGGDSSRITGYITSREGIGWSSALDETDDQYVKNGQFAWCGCFAAWCYTGLKFKIRFNSFASCYRLYRDLGNTSREVREFTKIRPGDIFTVWPSNSDRSYKWGDHIVIARSYPDADGEIETIEGNAKGYGPEGDWREGVSKRSRNISTIAKAYRPQAEDYGT